MNAKAAILGPLLVSGTLAAMVAAPQYALAQGKQTNSAALAKPLKAASDSLKARKYQETVERLRAAEGTPGKTAYDQHLINKMLGYACEQMKDQACAGKAYEALLTDGFSSSAEVASYVRTLVGINTATKNFDKVIEYGTRAIKDGGANDEIRFLVGQAYYYKGDYKGTIKYEDSYIESEIKAGQTPKLDTLKLAEAACAKQNDTACETRQLERIVMYYPKPEYWANLLSSLEHQASGDTNHLQVYRLMNEVDVLSSGSAYLEMASIALDQGSPAEAQHVLERATQKNLFGGDQRSGARAQRTLDSAKKKAAEEQQNLAKMAASADAAPNGNAEAALGLAYFGYQEYDKAVAALTKALAKGGLSKGTGEHAAAQGTADTQLLLGIAQLKAGHKDDAVKTFKQVKGDAFLERLASLWIIHAKQA
jgi:tetratricopeptide (TPR) repeat protein